MPGEASLTTLVKKREAAEKLDIPAAESQAQQADAPEHRAAEKRNAELQSAEEARGDLPNNNALTGNGLLSAQLYHQAGMVGKTGCAQLLGVAHRADPRIERR